MPRPATARFVLQSARGTSRRKEKQEMALDRIDAVAKACSDCRGLGGDVKLNRASHRKVRCRRRYGAMSSVGSGGQESPWDMLNLGMLSAKLAGVARGMGHSRRRTRLIKEQQGILGTGEKFGEPRGGRETGLFQRLAGLLRHCTVATRRLTGSSVRLSALQKLSCKH